MNRTYKKEIDKNVNDAIFYNDWHYVEYLMDDCWSDRENEYFEKNYSSWYVSYINLKK